MDSQLAWHKEELRNVLLKLHQLIKKKPIGRRTDPPRYARFLWFWLGGKNIPDCDNVSDRERGAVPRPIHNFYGWKACGTIEKLGLCSGALYRSTRYLEIDPKKRNGSRKQQNVHIEHTVPVIVLINALKNYISCFDTPATLHEFLIGHSVCAALHMDEKRLLSEAGVDSKRNPAFGDNGKRIGDCPFMRYEKLARLDKNFRLFNVVSGKEIEIEKFTFANHVETLEAASRLVMPSACGSTIYSLGMFCV